MFFQIGNRIVEVRRTHVIIALSIVVALLGVLGILSMKREVIALIQSTAFLAIMACCLVACLVFLGVRFGVFSRLRLGFDFEYRRKAFFSMLGDGVKENARMLIIVFVLFFGALCIIIFGFPAISLPDIGLAGHNVENYFPEKQPALESPDSSPQDTVKSTTTEKKATTTSMSKTTTTSTTTTTRKKPSPEGRTSGFFVYKKESGVEYRDCSFDGRGHDAILMSSGNYYCRSTEQRMTIKVDGVERICCVTP